MAAMMMAHQQQVSYDKYSSASPRFLRENPHRECNFRAWLEESDQAHVVENSCSCVGNERYLKEVECIPMECVTP